MSSLYAQCMLERYGVQVVEVEHGYIAYKIEGNICKATEIFVVRGMRGQGVWQALWDKLREECRAHGVESIIGFVDVTKAEPEKRLKAYIRLGAKIKEAKENIIIIEWRLYGA